MTLYRNVRPLLMSSVKDRDTALQDAEEQLKALGIVATGDVYAITCGEPMGAPGGTNMLKVHIHFFHNQRSVSGSKAPPCLPLCVPSPSTNW